MNPDELKEKYANLSTEELLEMLDNKFDYTDLAVSVALEELSSRKISTEDITAYKTAQVSKVVERIRRNIIDDLSLSQKNLFFFLWLPIITFPFKQNFREDGFLLKLRQATYYSLIGFTSFIAIGIASVSYNLSTITSLAFWVLCFIPAYFFDEYFNKNAQIERLRKELSKEEHDRSEEEIQ